MLSLTSVMCLVFLSPTKLGHFFRNAMNIWIRSLFMGDAECIFREIVNELLTKGQGHLP